MKQKSKKYVVPFRGHASSQKYNEFITNVVSDISNLITEVNDLGSLVRSSMLLTRQQLNELWAAVDKANVVNEVFSSIFADKHIFARSFHSAENIEFDSSSADAQHCVIDTVFGVLHLPVNGVVSLTNLPAYGGKQAVSGVTASVETSWDGTDYSYGADVATRGDITNMFNGDNESYWLMRFAFPMNSDVSSVKVRITGTLPNYSVGSGNVWYFKPGYVCGQQLETFSVSSSLTGDTFTDLFTDESIGRPLKKFTVPYSVARFRMVLEQPTWVEENNEKVFYVGLQELGIQYVEFDKTDWATSSPGNHIVFKVNAPEGYQFDGVDDIRCDPNIFDEVSYSSRNIRVRVFTDSYSGSPVLDTSTTNTFEVDFSSAVDTVYIEVGMRFNETISSGSPFNANSPAWLDNLAAVFSVSAS